MRLQYSSMVTPKKVLDYNPETGKVDVLYFKRCVFLSHPSPLFVDIMIVIPNLNPNHNCDTKPNLHADPSLFPKLNRNDSPFTIVQ